LKTAAAALCRKYQSPGVVFLEKIYSGIVFRRGCYGACWLEGTRILGHWNGRPRVFLDIGEVRLKGMHNVENIMAALLAAQARRVTPAIMVETIKDFRGVEHRCEPVASRRGIAFFNDSKSTTVDATVKALSMFADGSVMLICGGRDKGSDFRPIRRLIGKKAAGVVLIGEAQKKISAALGAGVKKFFAPTLERAVENAYRHSVPGMSVLLSPMCASFDMFDNFEHRGRVFKAAVRRLINHELAGNPDKFAAIALILICVGVVMIYSASAIYALENLGDSAYYLKRHLLYVIIGIVITGVVMSMDYQILRKLAKPLLFISFFLLLLLLVPGIGRAVGGARRWFRLGMFSFQPSELAKFSIIVYTADFIARKKSEVASFLSGFLPVLLILGRCACLFWSSPIWARSWRHR
jgi:UDP-N-acetylmuramoylalanine-D-glutamate ligase